MSTRKRTNLTNKDATGKKPAPAERTGSDTAAPGAGQKVQFPGDQEEKRKRRHDNINRQDDTNRWP